MARLIFTKALRRHVECPDETVDGNTIGEVLATYFAAHPAVRSYVVDDTGAIRKHVTVFVNSEQIADRNQLTDPIAAGDEIHVFQALSGG
ncbi:MAG: MoaD/ThiS family protein [Acidimicrobiia bacterium]